LEKQQQEQRLDQDASTKNYEFWAIYNFRELPLFAKPSTCILYKTYKFESYIKKLKKKKLGAAGGGHEVLIGDVRARVGDHGRLLTTP
jgi:hypothetical protein